MKKIKVYNINKLIDSKIKNKKLLGYFCGIAIIEGDDGVLVFNADGTGYKETKVNATIPLGLTDIPKENEIFIMPQYQVDISIKDLKESEYEEMLLTDFIIKHNYNNRLRQNFNIILETIDKIGLNSREYI